MVLTHRVRLLALCTLARAASGVRSVLVTGANKGIGRAIVQKIVEDYDDVHVFLGCRSAQRGEEAAAAIASAVPGCADRLSVLPLDVADDTSVAAAAAAVGARDELLPLHGILNNAGIGFGKGFDATLETNFSGARRVCDAFEPLLQPDGGRIVNVASASGPIYVAGLDDDASKKVLTSAGVGLDELDSYAKKFCGATDYENSAYGLSKACLNAYTRILASQKPKLLVNSVTPGYILTDLTRGMGATNPPEKGTTAPIYCLFEATSTGWYYGSDAVRSPLDRYRGPGDPPYEGD